MKAAELARVAQIHRATLKHYESGERFPGAKELRRLCEALDRSPNELIYGDDGPLRFETDEAADLEFGWALHIPSLIRAALGFRRLPVNDQIAITHLVTSMSSKYFRADELDQMALFIEEVRPLAEVFAQGDFDKFNELITTLPERVNGILPQGAQPPVTTDIPPDSNNKPD